MTTLCINASQRMYMTKLTRDWFKKDREINMHNRKPFRTKQQKAIARQKAEMIGGTYYSHAPRSYHSDKEHKD